MLFPIADDNRDRLALPVVNIALIAINILVFVFFQQMATNDNFTLAYSAVPAEIAAGKDLVTEDRERVVETPRGRVHVTVPGLQTTPIPVYLTIFTAMFMHGSLAHIAGNMWFLWIFGDNIEDDLGRLRYTIFYLLCGVLATLAHVFVSLSGDSAMIPSLGASGAISGVMGAYLVLHAQRRVTVIILRFGTMDVPGFVAVGIWFLVQLIEGLGLLGGGSGGVAYMAHIGGFIAGAALIWPFMLGRPRKAAVVDWEDERSIRTQHFGR
jgi:membrane associated rhomboid family serine protease